MGNIVMAAVYWIRHQDHTDMFTQGYIGVSQNAETRFEEHRKKSSNPHLKYAINKYGWTNLVKEIVLIAHKSYCLLIETQLRNKIDIGWNVAIGGGNPPDSTGNKYKLGIPSWSKGKKFSDEHKKNLSIAHIGQVAWNTGKKGLQIAWNKGLPISPNAQKAILQKVECPHCKKIGTVGGMKRFHFDNCKGQRNHPARVTVNGKRIFIGSFAKKEDAKMAQLNYVKDNK